jgi:hypothetical protein
LKILAIPDSHGFDHWKTIIDRIDDFDKIVFLGDYFDSFIVPYTKQMKNFKNILAFADAHQTKVELCIGNHDIAYISGLGCSGHQWEHERAIRKILLQNLDRLNVVHKHGNWLFSHAGFSKLWMQENRLEFPEEANLLLYSKPLSLEWVGPDGYGNNPNESPLWIRPNSLIMNAVEGFNQCVGHTEIAPELEPKGIIQFGNKFIFTDTKHHNEFITIEVNDYF